MCQTNAAAIHLFINLERYCCTCTALRVLHYASQFKHTACCSYGIRHGSFTCSSCHFVHFVLRCAPLHHVRSYAVCYNAGHPATNTQELSKAGMHLSFGKAHTTLLTGLHSAPLRPAFTSVALSLLPANFLLPFHICIPAMVLLKKTKCMKDRCSTCKDMIDE